MVVLKETWTVEKLLNETSFDASVQARVNLCRAAWLKLILAGCPLRQMWLIRNKDGSYEHIQAGNEDWLEFYYFMTQSAVAPGGVTFTDLTESMADKLYDAEVPVCIVDAIASPSTLIDLLYEAV